jgi:hypothetical protein
MIHAPRQLREAFRTIVDGNDEHYPQIWEDVPMSYDTLLLSLTNCSDIMPRDTSELLFLPQGSTYAMGVGAYIALYGLPDEED